MCEEADASARNLVVFDRVNAIALLSVLGVAGRAFRAEKKGARNFLLQVPAKIEIQSHDAAFDRVRQVDGIRYRQLVQVWCVVS